MPARKKPAAKRAASSSQISPPRKYVEALQAAPSSEQTRYVARGE
jgi:hypothetical protein